MYYLNQNHASGQSFSAGYPIGTDVFGEDDTALAVGDLNGDRLPDIVMPDGIRINQGSTGGLDFNMFNQLPDVTFPGMNPWKKVYIADMDRTNTYPDLVGIDTEGAVYMARSSVEARDMRSTIVARWDTSKRWVDNQMGLFASRNSWMVQCKAGHQFWLRLVRY